MTMWFRQFGLFFLLLLGMADSFAGPDGPHRNELRGAVFHTQNAALERGEVHRDQQIPMQGADGRPREFGLAETNGFSAQAERDTNASDYPPRQGRMSVEERRALRRQIDEVGHDIYGPRH
jgi:hypothetical protein